MLSSPPFPASFTLLRLLLASCLVLGLLWAPAPLAADEPPSEAPPVEGDDEQKPPVGPTLHKIYVPFRELRKVFGKENKGVFLPYEEFRDLWRRANEVDEAPAGPPVKATVRAATYEGTADGDMVRLDARLEVEVLAKGWHQIHLDYAGAGIERATIDGAPALLTPAGSGYDLLLEDPGQRTLELALRIPTSVKGDLRSARFSVPPVPLSRLVLDLPGAATEVEVSPRLASTTQPAEGNRTRLQAFLGAVDNVRITWHQRTEEEPSVEPLVFVAQIHDVRIDQGVLRSEFVGDLSVLRAPLEQLRLAVPADAVTLYVQGDGIRTWSRSEDGTSITIELREPVKDAWQVRVGLERPLPALPADVVLPLAAVEGVERETGVLRLLAGEGVKLEPGEMPGLLQVDVGELPAALQGAPPGRALAYRFPARPGAARVGVQALEPRLSARLGERVVIRPEGTEVRYAATLTVERSGIFGVRFELPKDLEVTAVRVGGIEKDDHKVREEEGKRILSVDFRDRLLGLASVQIDGRRSTPLPPEEEDDEAAEVEFDVPLLTLLEAEHIAGYVAIQVDTALEHREVTRSGLVPLDAGAPAALEPANVPGPPAPLAHRYEHHAGEIALRLGLKRRDPVVTAQVETFLRLEPDRTRVGVTLRYHVRYRGVDTLRFTAPLAVGERTHLDLEGVQLLGPEEMEQPAGAQEAAVRGLWTIKLPSARMGAVPIVLEVEDLPSKPLASGDTPRPVRIPTFVPWGADGKALPNTVHNVAVRRDPLLEIVPDELERAEEIDSRELPPALRAQDNFLAFRSYDPTWAAQVFVTRHDYEPVADVVVTQVHLDTVLSPGERATTDAYLLVMNNARQSLELRLPQGAKVRAVTVNEKSRPPRQGDGDRGTVLVPIPSGLGKSETFVVALSYDHDVVRSRSLMFETTRVESLVPVDVTSDLLTWRVFAPGEKTYTAFGGTVEPAEPKGSWFARLVSALSSTLGKRIPGASLDVERIARGFKSPFPTRHEGKDFLFSNRVGTGVVEITGVEPVAFALYKLLWFGVFLVGGLALARLAGRIGLGEATFLTAVVLVLLVLLVRADPGTAQILNSMLYGVLIAGAMRLLVHVQQRSRERRATQAASTPDSDSQDPDPESPTPATEGGAA